jgi:hypothetical protein
VTDGSDVNVWFVALEGLFRHKINVFTKLIKSPQSMITKLQSSKIDLEFVIVLSAF